MSKHEILLAGQLTNSISVTNKLYVVYCLSLGNCVNRQAHLCFVFLWEIASIGKPIMFSFCLFVGNCVIGKPKFNKISVFHLGDSSREKPSQKSLNLLNLI